MKGGSQRIAISEDSYFRGRSQRSAASASPARSSCVILATLGRQKCVYTKTRRSAGSQQEPTPFGFSARLNVQKMNSLYSGYFKKKKLNKKNPIKHQICKHRSCDTEKPRLRVVIQLQKHLCVCLRTRGRLKVNHLLFAKFLLEIALLSSKGK